VKKYHPEIYLEIHYQDDDEAEVDYEDVYTFRDVDEDEDDLGDVEEDFSEEPLTEGELEEIAGQIVSDSFKRGMRTRSSDEKASPVWASKIKGIQRPKAIMPSRRAVAGPSGKESVPVSIGSAGDLADHDDSDIIKELHQMDVVRSQESFFAPVRKTPSISSASSPHPSLRSGNGNVNGRKEDEISLECRSDCNFSAIDESSNADTFRTESPPLAEGVNPGHIDPANDAPRTSGRPTRAASARAPKWDQVVRTRTRRGPDEASTGESSSKKPKTIHI
jgi:hypothetical protein